MESIKFLIPIEGLLDTNIFLGLYDTEEDPEDIMGDIEQVKSHLIFTDLVMDEFLRNRDRVLERNGARIGDAGIAHLQPPFFLQQEAAFSSLRRSTDEYNLAIKSLIDAIYSMILDPDRDPVYSALLKLYGDPAVTVIKRTDPDILRAHRRKLIGNPPTSSGAETVGDELNWELLLDHVKEDLILVSRDYTYRHHCTFLSREYRERTGKQLQITDRISDVLKEFAKSPSRALLGFEEAWKGRTD